MGVLSSDEYATGIPHEMAEDVDSDIWRRVYDSVARRWVVGPLVYIVAVAAFAVVGFDASVASGLAFGASLAALS
jgi:hypothetical protein